VKLTQVPASIDEQKRLQALRDLEVLDSGPELEFDALVKAAALVCGTPISLISLVEENRQWFKANVGLPGVTETSRDVSFCAHAMQQGALMEVEDATKDRRFSANPLVNGDPGIRFYAGVPLALTNGQNVGSLCVIDREPRKLTQHQRDVLSHLGYAAARALEARIAVQSEKELRLVESRAASILKSSPDAIVTMGLDGQIQHYNDAAERLFACTADDLIGQSIYRFVPALLDDQRMVDVTAWLAKETGKSFETTGLRWDGASFPISIAFGQVVSGFGTFLGMTAIIRDIRDLVNARATAIENEERVRRLYETTPAMMHSIDATGRLLSVSDRWLEVLGYRREDVIGRFSSEFLTEESRVKARTVLPEFFRTGHCEQVEYQLVSSRGEIIDVLLSATLERDPEGKPIRTMAIIEDVTLRRLAERRLAEEKQRLANIIEGTQAGTWEWNVQTGETRFNERWAEIIGYTLSELQPVSIDTWMRHAHPDDLYSSGEYLHEHFDGKSDAYDFEARMRHREGHWVWVHDRGKVITWTPDGKPEWMFGTHQDITLRKIQEDTLRKSQIFLDRTGRVAGVGGWEVDLQTGDIVWSEETCRIHGVEPGYVPTMDEAIAYYAPEARPIIQNAVENSMATGEGWDLELPFIKASGERIWVRAVGAVEFEGDKPIHISGALQDISERVEQRIAVERLNDQMAAATDNGRIGIWDADLRSGRTYYSDMWCELLGYSREEFGDAIDNWLKLVHPDDRERAKAADRDHIAGEAAYFEEEFRMRRKDGSWVWILDRGRVVARNDDGSPVRMIGTHIDITRQKAEEEERRLLAERMSIATDSGGIGIWDYDLVKNVVTWDPWMYRLFGLPERNGERVPDLWRRHIHKDDYERIEQAVSSAIRESRALNEEYRIIRPDHSTHYIRISAKIISDDAGQPLRLIGAAWDVSAQRKLALELADQHELMRVTLHSIGDAVMTTDALGIVQWLNPVAERMTSWSAAEASGQPSGVVFNIINEETRQRAPDPITACLQTLDIVGLDENTMLIARDGREFSVEDSAAPIRNSEGNVLGAVLVFHDVSEQRRLSREMRHRASHDPLTGLINRAEFDRRLQTVFKKSRFDGSSNVLLYIDLDQFKIVNDSCGHAVGDDLLKQVSKLLADTIRSGDSLARLGGDEFGVILESCTAENATHIAQAICDRMRDFRFVQDDKRFRVGTSIGLVPIDATMQSLASILQAADNACYAAKEGGRNRVHVWVDTDQAMAARSGEMRWASRIERALDDDQFVLFAQNIRPISGKLAGRHVELLIRMKDEDGSLISPSAFLPSAERFNLATRVDQWVLTNAIEWIASLPEATETETISINLSGHSVGDRSFHRQAMEVLDEAGEAVCRRLCFEITETAAITNLADATTFIDQVRSRGVRVALDDFGAGASSFGYLKRFPVDYLKIDGQFIRELTDDPLNDVTVRCFVDVARVLGIKTVAEYVESAEILSKLASIGVDYAQGFHIHKPEAI
jgi:diguanylate cyclase (GGDEF)-like protein/PAS domain S-box-containing protein